MEEGNNISEEMRATVFTQLMQQIRKQDDLVHSWTKYFLSIQAGIAAALAFLIQMEAKGSGLLITAGLLLLPCLGITTTVFLTRLIIRDLKWQGRYILALRKLKGVPGIYDFDPDPNRRGFQARQFLWLHWILIIGWVLLGLITVERQFNLVFPYLPGLF